MGTPFQILLVALCAVALLLFLRIVFPSRDNQNSRNYQQLHEENQRRFADSFRNGSNEGSAPVSSNLGRITVTAFNFAHFDAVPGPADAECFADELILELYDSVSDFRWTATYVVATPAGIRKMMDDERWSFFYATELFVVRRYDLQLIREAVYGRLNEIHAQVSLDAEEPPMWG
jgi:hypothetical protein